MSNQTRDWASFLSSQPQQSLNPSFVDFDLPNFGLDPTDLSEPLLSPPNDNIGSNQPSEMQ